MGPLSGSCDLREGGCVLTNYLDTHATCLLKPLKLFEGSSFLRTQRGVTSDMSWCARQVNPKERRKKNTSVNLWSILVHQESIHHIKYNHLSSTEYWFLCLKKYKTCVCIQTFNVCLVSSVTCYSIQSRLWFLKDLQSGASVSSEPPRPTPIIENSQFWSSLNCIIERNRILLGDLIFATLLAQNRQVKSSKSYLEKRKAHEFGELCTQFSLWVALYNLLYFLIF